jgi:hypothetical protein
MKCFHHPSEDAVATCAQCGVGLCKECEEASEFRSERKAFCKRCNAEERAKFLTKYKWQKWRIIGLSILFVPGIFVFVVGALDNQLAYGIIGCLLIWGVSGIGSVLKDAFFPASGSIKQQTKEALAEHEYPLASLIGKVLGFFIRLIVSYALYAVLLPFKLGYSILFVAGNKKIAQSI